MRHFFVCILLLVSFLSGTSCFAQDKQFKEMHKVKRSETIFGIAKKYGLTVNDLIKANPEMNTPGYELKKGDYIFIPNSDKTATVQEKNKNNTAKPAVTKPRGVKVGVVLPLHDVDGDGRRMVEYYRGLLMASEDLKKSGTSVDFCAYNLPVDGDVNNITKQAELAKCDIIFGPLYTRQVTPLADFARSKGIKLVIPFSINGNDVLVNPNIYQVYQSPEFFYDEVIKHFVYRFSNYNVVVIDCNDRSSDKGIFTFGLRKKLEERNIPCNVTNLNSSDEMFAKAFSLSKPNMVILNTGRSPELNRVLARLDDMTHKNPSCAISMFGYTEWLMYVKYNRDRFFKYDTYIPTSSYYNSYSGKIKALESRYVSSFGSGMMDYLPRFAITGYDHAMFFIRGLDKYGKKFDASQADTDALQTRLHFRKAGAAGGYKNAGFMFVHYNRNNTISIINF